MELSSIKPTTTTAELVHPGTGEGLGLIFTLRSPHHPEVRAAEREWQNAQLRKKNMDITVEQFEAAKVKILATHVESWRFEENAEATIDGGKPDFSAPRLKKLIREHEWIREWLDAETGKVSRFYKGLGEVSAMPSNTA